MNANPKQYALTTSDPVVSENPNPVSRRSFIGTAAGAVGAASLGWAGAATLTAKAANPSSGGKKDLRVGMLTAPVSNQPFDQVLDMAKRCGIAALEVVSGPGSKHIDPMTFGQAEADAVKKMLADRGLEISSLANYMNTLAPGKTDEVQAIVKKMIDAAVLLGVPTICMITGIPQDRTSKITVIKQVLPKIFRPILDHAKDQGINVAVENWFATCLQGLDTFDCLMEAIPDENFGLNFDPSHLLHQQCDYTIPVEKFGDRIFHTHAKDCLVDVQQRSYVGVLGDGWWRYVIPGYGDVKWGDYISHLREVGYKGVLSIEHEDKTFSAEDGFRHGARFLNRFCQ